VKRSGDIAHALPIEAVFGCSIGSTSQRNGYAVTKMKGRHSDDGDREVFGDLSVQPLRRRDCITTSHAERTCTPPKRAVELKRMALGGRGETRRGNGVEELRYGSMFEETQMVDRHAGSAPARDDDWSGR
jgi:hypothetical protein